MVTNDPGEDRMIEDCVYLAANTRLGDGDRLIDRLIVYSNTVRRAKAAKFPPSCVENLEGDLLRILEGFYRRVERYRDPSKN